MKSAEFLLLKVRERTIFQRLSFFALLYTFPLLLTNVLYKDDIRRTIFASPETWYRDGRPLMALLIELFTLGRATPDISPLPLLFGVLILSYALTCFGRKYLSDFTVWRVVLCLFTFIMSPLFLENLSFKYESIGMCMSLSLFLFLFSLPDEITNTKLVFTSIIITLTVLLTYQASIGAFLALLFLTALLETDTKTINKIILSACSKCLGFLIAILAYLLILSPRIVATDGYQGKVSQRVPLSTESLTILIRNCNYYFNLFTDVFFPGISSPITWLSITALLAVLLYTLGKAFHHIKSKDYAKCIFTLLVPQLIILSSFLQLCIFKIPVVMPRSLLSFNVFMLLTGIAIVSLTRTRRFSILVFIPIYLSSFSFIFTYSNLLHTQRQYEEFIAKSVARDLNRIKNIDSTFLFYIDGRVLKTQELALAQKHYRILNYLIVNIYHDYFWFGGDLISHYTNFHFNVRKLEKKDYRNYQMITGNSVYRIMQKEKSVVVDFKHPVK